jgi:metal-dependent hydrolase (beta-lactamase superfamily II)
MSAKPCLRSSFPTSFWPGQESFPARRCFALVSGAENVRHTLLFDTGPEGAIFIRNCVNLGIRLGEVECIAVSHGHWDHMAALPSPASTGLSIALFFTVTVVDHG